MKIKLFQSIPKEAVAIREKVFVEEQGFEYEFDSIDDIATHFVMFDDNNVPIATCRVFFNEERNAYILGRLAVIKESRGKSIGKMIVEKAEEYIRSIGGNELYLHAQCRITPFYQRLGFSSFGDVEYEEDCPHVWMKKSI